VSAPGCADPDGCPVPDPDQVDLRRLTSIVLPSGTPLRRGHKVRYPGQQPVPASPRLPTPDAMTRFAPVPGAPHAYVARREIAALLETVLHEVVPGTPRIRWPQLAHWALSHVTLRRSVRLVDLRDPALAALGLDRSQLITTDPGHYPCTRAWADRLHGRHVGGRPTAGLLWHSRQAEIHADQGIRPILADVLVGEQAEVAVLWPADPRPLLNLVGGPWRLDQGRGLELVRDVANLLGAPPPLAGPTST
jgi:hypothetical protein